MNLFSSDNYCSMCGENLICSHCGGTGKVGKDIDTTRCCGQDRISDYCPVCGTLLKFSYSKKSDCFYCNGGRIIHKCTKTFI